MKYECGMTEFDEKQGWVCPIDNPNESVNACKDCAFVIEHDKETL